MSKVLFILILLIFTSCVDKPQKENQTEQIVMDSSKQVELDISKLNYKEFVLDPKAENEISNWQKYNEFRVKIEEFKTSDLSHFNSDFETIETFMKEFTNTVPLNINEESIQARILAVETMYFRLNNVYNMNNSSIEKVQNALEGLLEAFSNLNYQINKKFERDFQKISRPE